MPCQLHTITKPNKDATLSDGRGKIVESYSSERRLKTGDFKEREVNERATQKSVIFVKI